MTRSPKTSKAVSGLENLTTPEVHNLDLPVWQEVPAKEGQLLEEGQWKKGDTKVILLDLSKSEDLEEYSKLVNFSLKEDPTVIILDEQKQFCKSSENWKILITTTDILYRQLIEDKK